MLSTKALSLERRGRDLVVDVLRAVVRVEPLDLDDPGGQDADRINGGEGADSLSGGAGSDADGSVLLLGVEVGTVGETDFVF